MQEAGKSTREFSIFSVSSEHCSNSSFGRTSGEQR